MLAEELEAPNKWVTDRIAEARAAGYLTETKQGRGDGELTDEGWRVLREMDTAMAVVEEAETLGRAWLLERAGVEGVDRKVMNHGQWMRWSEQRLQAPDSPFRTPSHTPNASVRVGTT